LRQAWFWTATGLGVLTLLLVVVNGVLFLGNQTRQAEVSERQRFIGQSVQLSQINEQLIRALTQQAIGNKDDKLLDLLAQNGIAVSPASSGATPSTAAPAPSPAPQSGIFLPTVRK
jgi:hypothetical protein